MLNKSLPVMMKEFQITKFKLMENLSVLEKKICAVDLLNKNGFEMQAYELYRDVLNDVYPGIKQLWKTSKQIAKNIRWNEKNKEKQQ